jgi:copper chaperone
MSAETIRLTIVGMSCDHCVNAVTGALQTVAGVDKATVSLAEESAVVTGKDLDPTALIAAVEEEGYEAVPA